MPTCQAECFDIQAGISSLCDVNSINSRSCCVPSCCLKTYLCQHTNSGILKASDACTVFDPHLRSHLYVLEVLLHTPPHSETHAHALQAQNLSPPLDQTNTRHATCRAAKKQTTATQSTVEVCKHMLGPHHNTHRHTPPTPADSEGPSFPNKYHTTTTQALKQPTTPMQRLQMPPKRTR